MWRVLGCMLFMCGVVFAGKPQSAKMDCVVTHFQRVEETGRCYMDRVCFRPDGSRIAISDVWLCP